MMLIHQLMIYRFYCCVNWNYSLMETQITLKVVISSLKGIGKRKHIAILGNFLHAVSSPGMGAVKNV